MALNQEDLSQIHQMIQDALPRAQEGIDLRYEMEVRERIVRVEEELKNQSGLLLRMMQQSDQRFEQVEKHFEQVDKRFEQIERRFEQVDKRFEEMRNDLKHGLLEVNRRIDRFMYWSLGLTVTAAIFVVKMLGG